MKMKPSMKRWFLILATVCGLSANAGLANDVARIDERFAVESVTETPDFRQHVVPLMGKLGCNGRACHGSFQGRGGFRLSLFGYDFKADHEALTQGEKPRVNRASITESLMLQKPLQIIPHEGGTRLTEGSWQHRVLTRWLQGGAKPIGEKTPEFVRLEVTPQEIVVQQRGEQVALKVVAVWSNGTREDVTPLSRFQTNNDRIATIDDKGVVTSADAGDTHVVAFYDGGVVPIAVIQPVSEKFGANYPSVPTPTKIDELVVQKLRKLGMTQSDVCTDAEFLRRVSLDMIGTLPSPAEVEAFLADPSTDKRPKKIDELLERPAYPAWWATRFADWTGNNASKLTDNRSGVDNDVRASDWYEWLRTRIEKNVPYDQIAEGIVLAVSRQPNESYADFSTRMSGYYHKDSQDRFADQPSMTYYWTRQNFRTSEDRALGFAYTFLGLRIQCAQCHKHPFDQWTKDDFDRFKEFFSRVQYSVPPASRDEERELFAKVGIDPKLKGNDLGKAIKEQLSKGAVIPFFEVFVPAANRRNDRVANNKGNKPQVGGRTAKILGGEEVKIEEMADPREALMEWMRDESNPYFARAIVNRVWSGYFNVGIVEPADDLSLANPPSNDALLDYLEAEFRQHKYDLKWLHRTIANSRTYQLSWRSNDTNQFDERNFARAVLRRLPAEVTYDAVQLATMSDADAAVWQTDVTRRAIGNPVVASKDNRKVNKSNQSYALNIFGRSIRVSNCECDRSSESSLLQTVYLQNDNEVLVMIGGRGRWADQIVSQKNVGENPSNAATKTELNERQQRRLTQVGADRLKERIEQLEKAGRTEQAERIKRILDQKVESPVTDGTVATPISVAVSAVDVKAIITKAYLRTVSRYPSESETSRASMYYEETGDVARGTRDLLWALVNTKEFVLNH